MVENAIFQRMETESEMMLAATQPWATQEGELTYPADPYGESLRRRNSPWKYAGMMGPREALVQKARRFKDIKPDKI